jgi:hypothetical protein
MRYSLFYRMLLFLYIGLTVGAAVGLAIGDVGGWWFCSFVAVHALIPSVLGYCMGRSE